MIYHEVNEHEDYLDAHATTNKRREEGANGFSTVSALAEKLTDDHMCEKRRVSTTKVFETWAGKK